LKTVDLDFQTATGIGENINTSSNRPSFMKKKGAVRSVKQPASNLSALNKFDLE
jgi:hypothetical protein